MSPLNLIEVEAKKRLEGQELVSHEAGLLRAQISDADRIIALDERGESWSSERFAGAMRDWRDSGTAGAAFLIGGHNGLEESFRRGTVLSFGKSTWPHMLARVMLMEQIFRAIAIIAGHPYHRA